MPLSTPVYTTLNPYFDPLASYTFYGDVTFAGNPPIHNSVSVVVQDFGVPGASVYVPTPGMKSCIVRCQGAGGSGGAPSAVPGGAGGSGGGAGGYCEGYYTAATIASLSPITITVGAGGAGVANANGNAGGTTSFGVLLNGFGGFAGSAVVNTAGGAGGVSNGGYLQNPGTAGSMGFELALGRWVQGVGGSNQFSGSGTETTTVDFSGSVVEKGAGSAGSVSFGANAPSLAGGNGLVIITEYL